MAKFHPNYPNNPNCPNYLNYPNSLGMFQTKANHEAYGNTNIVEENVLRLHLQGQASSHLRVTIHMIEACSL